MQAVPAADHKVAAFSGVERLRRCCCLSPVKNFESCVFVGWTSWTKENLGERLRPQCGMPWVKRLLADRFAKFRCVGETYIMRMGSFPLHSAHGKFPL